MDSQADLEANKAIVLSFWKAFSESRFADVLELLADNATWRVMGNTSISNTYSKADFQRWFTTSLTAQYRAFR